MIKNLPLKAGVGWMWSGVDVEWGRLRRPGRGEGAHSRDRDEGDASVPTPRLIHRRPNGKTGFLPPSLDAYQGDASVPSPHIIHPRPYEKTGFLRP